MTLRWRLGFRFLQNNTKDYMSRMSEVHEQRSIETVRDSTQLILGVSHIKRKMCKSYLWVDHLDLQSEIQQSHHLLLSIQGCWRVVIGSVDFCDAESSCVSRKVIFTIPFSGVYPDSRLSAFRVSIKSNSVAVGFFGLPPPLPPPIVCFQRFPFSPPEPPLFCLALSPSRVHDRKAEMIRAGNDWFVKARGIPGAAHTIITKVASPYDQIRFIAPPRVVLPV